VTETTIAAARDMAAVWRREAESRRRVSRQDPVADALEYCAAELIEHLRVVDGLNAVRTVDQFAADHGITPQTVRGWIRRGELQATRTAHGWRIPRSAQRMRRSRTTLKVEDAERGRE
jgi:excisionase family DNA binding protein